MHKPPIESFFNIITVYKATANKPLEKSSGKNNQTKGEKTMEMTINHNSMLYPKKIEKAIKTKWEKGLKDCIEQWAKNALLEHFNNDCEKADKYFIINIFNVDFYIYSKDEIGICVEARCINSYLRIFMAMNEEFKQIDKWNNQVNIFIQN